MDSVRVPSRPGRPGGWHLWPKVPATFGRRCQPPSAKGASHLVLAVGVLAVLATSASGQTTATAAGVSGRVTDVSGAAIGRAQIGVSNADTGQRLTTTTDTEGRYRLLSIPPGRHRVTASAPGFAPAAVDITLALDDSATVLLTLRLATLAETVTVTGEPSIIDVSRTQAADSVTPREVQTLPLNGRNYLDLALLTTGVSRTNAGAAQRFAETSAIPGTGISVSSQRNLNNSFIVDGLSANDDAAGLSGAFFSQEVIREFQVVTGGGVAECRAPLRHAVAAGPDRAGPRQPLATGRRSLGAW